MKCELSNSLNKHNLAIVVCQSIFELNIWVFGLSFSMSETSQRFGILKFICIAVSVRLSNRFSWKIDEHIPLNQKHLLLTNNKNAFTLVLYKLTYNNQTKKIPLGTSKIPDYHIHYTHRSFFFYHHLDISTKYTHFRERSHSNETMLYKIR